MSLEALKAAEARAKRDAELAPSSAKYFQDQRAETKEAVAAEIKKAKEAVAKSKEDLGTTRASTPPSTLGYLSRSRQRPQSAFGMTNSMGLGLSKSVPVLPGRSQRRSAGLGSHLELPLLQLKKQAQEREDFFDKDKEDFEFYLKRQDFLEIKDADMSQVVHRLDEAEGWLRDPKNMLALSDVQKEILENPDPLATKAASRLRQEHRASKPGVPQLTNQLHNSSRRGSSLQSLVRAKSNSQRFSHRRSRKPSDLTSMSDTSSHWTGAEITGNKKRAMDHFREALEATKHLDRSNPNQSRTMPHKMDDTRVDFLQAERMLQACAHKLLGVFGLDDERTKVAVENLMRCYTAQGTDREYELSDLELNTANHIEAAVEKNNRIALDVVEGFQQTKMGIPREVQGFLITKARTAKMIVRRRKENAKRLRSKSSFFEMVSGAATRRESENQNSQSNSDNEEPQIHRLPSLPTPLVTGRPQSPAQFTKQLSALLNTKIITPQIQKVRKTGYQKPRQMNSRASGRSMDSSFSSASSPRSGNRGHSMALTDWANRPEDLNFADEVQAVGTLKEYKGALLSAKIALEAELGCLISTREDERDEWQRTNRLDPKTASKGEDLKSRGFLSDHLEQEEYGVVAETCMRALKENVYNPTAYYVLKDSISELRQFPKKEDFYAEFKVWIDSDQVIIGESFKINYRYIHYVHPLYGHPPRDWLAVFEMASSDTPADRTVEEGKLLGWRQIPEENEGTVNCSRIVEKPGFYRVVYFVAGTNVIASTSQTFSAAYATVVVDCPTIVKCGDDIVVNYAYNYHGLTHSGRDWAALFAFKDGKLDRSSQIRCVVLPNKNSGSFIVRAPSYPGNYQLIVFLKDFGAAVAGSSGIIEAQILFDVGSVIRRRRNRQIKVYLSTRWDMEMEREVFNNKVAPHLKKICEARHVAFSFVDLRSELIPTRIMTPLGISNVIDAIEACFPYFLCCLGEQDDIEMKLDHLNQFIMAKCPWVHDIVKESRTDPTKPKLTITGMEAMLAYLIPKMQQEHLGDFCFFYGRHPSLRCQLHSLLQSISGGAEAVNRYQKESKERMKNLKAKLRNSKAQFQQNYSYEPEITEGMLRDFIGMLDDVYPADTAPALEDLPVLRDDLYHRAGNHEYFDEDTDYVRNQDYTGKVSYLAFSKNKGTERKMSIYTIMDEFINSSMSNGLMIIDQQGFGLSSLLMSWMQKHKTKVKNHLFDDTVTQYGEVLTRIVYGIRKTNKQGEKAHKRMVLLLYIDLSIQCHRYTAQMLVWRICLELHHTFRLDGDLPPKEFEQTPSEMLTNYLEFIEDQGDLILILDGLDSLKDDDQLPLWYLPERFPPHFRIIGTCFPYGRVKAHVEPPTSHWDLVKRKLVGPILNDIRTHMADRILRHHKMGALTSWLSDLLEGEKTQNLVWFETALSFLCVEKSIPDTQQFVGLSDEQPKDMNIKGVQAKVKIQIDKLLNFDQFENFCISVIKNLQYKEELVSLSLGLISLSRYGLGEWELVRLLSPSWVGMWNNMMSRSSSVASRKDSHPAFSPLNSPPKDSHFAFSPPSSPQKVKTQRRRKSEKVRSRMHSNVALALNEEKMLDHGTFSKVLDILKPMTTNLLGLLSIGHFAWQQAIEDHFFDDTNRLTLMSILSKFWSEEIPTERKSIELPWILVQMGNLKVDDSKAGRKIKKQTKETLLECILESSMFSLLFREEHMEDFMYYVRYTGASPEKIANTLRHKFETHWELIMNTSRTADSHPGVARVCRYHRLNADNLQQNYAAFRQNAPHMLIKMGEFLFYRFQETPNAQQMLEEALLMSLNVDSFDGVDKYCSAISPATLPNVVKCFGYLADIYIGHARKSYDAITTAAKAILNAHKEQERHRLGVTQPLVETTETMHKHKLEARRTRDALKRADAAFQIVRKRMDLLGEQAGNVRPLIGPNNHELNKQMNNFLRHHKEYRKIKKSLIQVIKTATDPRGAKKLVIGNVVSPARRHHHTTPSLLHMHSSGMLKHQHSNFFASTT